MSEIVTSVLQKKKVIYYPASKSELAEVKSTSVLANIFLALASLFIGGTLTVGITLQTPNLDSMFEIKLNSYLHSLIAAGIIFSVLFIIFLVKNNKAIKEITSYGAIIPSDNFLRGEFELKIIAASYYSLNAQHNAKEKISHMIINNTVAGIANNETFGDPELGKDKWLRITYSLNGEEFTKEYNQGAYFKLPPNKPIEG